MDKLVEIVVWLVALTNSINQPEQLQPISQIPLLRPLVAGIEASLPDYISLVELQEEVLDQIDKLSWEEKVRRTAGEPVSNLVEQIDDCVTRARAAFESFVGRYPWHVFGKLAYGRFLHRIGDAEGAEKQFQKALELSACEPAVWNALGVFYFEEHEIKRAFAALEKARELDPADGLYDRNLAYAISTYRKDALEFYNLASDVDVLRKAIELFREAVRKTNSFLYQKELAEVYYFLPKGHSSDAVRAMEQEAIEQWKHAIRLARTDAEADEARVHLARWYLRLGLLDQATAVLQSVNSSNLQSQVEALRRRIEERHNNTEAKE